MTSSPPPPQSWSTGTGATPTTATTSLLQAQEGQRADKRSILLFTNENQNSNSSNCFLLGKKTKVFDQGNFI
jgi:hypothetical protein